MTLDIHIFIRLSVEYVRTSSAMVRSVLLTVLSEWTFFSFLRLIFKFNRKSVTTIQESSILGPRWPLLKMETRPDSPGPWAPYGNSCKFILNDKWGSLCLSVCHWSCGSVVWNTYYNSMLWKHTEFLIASVQKAVVLAGCLSLVCKADPIGW